MEGREQLPEAAISVKAKNEQLAANRALLSGETDELATNTHSLLLYGKLLHFWLISSV